MPTANSSARLSKIAAPACITNGMFNTSSAPSRRSSAAAGNTATGSINALPSFCRPLSICNTFL